MGSKKGNNEGTIRKRSDGRWEARCTVGYDDDGKQVQRSIYGKTRAEVMQQLNQILVSMAANEYIAPSKMTVGIWFETWLKNYAQVAIRPSTYISYEGYIYNHIKPKLGNSLLQDLTTDRLQAFYNDRSSKGRVDGKGGLSAKTMRNMHNMLHEALDQAMKNRLVPENTSNACVLPKQHKKEISILSRDEQKRLLKFLGSERLGFAVLLDLSTGIRIGELCCLRWTDIDMDRRLIIVRRTLQRVKSSLIDREKEPDYRTKILEGSVKTDNGYRDIPVQDKVFMKLLEYKQLQDAEKELAGCAYIDNGYVFASQLGRAIEPATMRDMFNRLLAEAKLSHYTFHALRHTFATRAIENGVSIKAVSDILGHSTVQLTMDLYCHASVDLKREAVNLMADLW